MTVLLSRVWSDTKDLCTENGVNIVMEFLDSELQVDVLNARVQAWGDIMFFNREPGSKIDDFISEFEARINRMKAVKLDDLPADIKAITQMFCSGASLEKR